VKNFNWWSVAAIATMGAALTACGSGGNSSSNSSVRIANATLTHPSLDLLVGGTVASSAVLTDTVGAYTAPAAGVTALQVNDSGSATALAATTPSLSGGLHYTLLAYESGGVVKTAVLNEDYAAPAAGVAQIRVYNAAPDAGKLDVYITPSTVTSLSGLSATFNFTTGVVPLSSTLQTESVGTYTIWVTGYSNANDIRIVVPNVTVASQQIATVVLTPSTGGVLLNGSTLIQQGAYSATRNTSARVRLASAVSGAAIVAASATASANTTTIDAGSAAPSFGYYVLVPASSAINVSINSASVAAPASTLTAGSDFTLLVYGSPTTARATLIADDNRPPADTTTTKLRMINGVNGTAGALTLTANNSLVANALAAGAASGYSSVALSTTLATTLTLTSASQPGSFLSTSTSALAPGVVYTIFAAGDTAQAGNAALGPQFLIR
jgi:hypothetical protein